MSSIRRERQVDVSQRLPGDLPGAVVGGVAGRGQHADRALVGALPDVPITDSGARYPHPIGQSGIHERGPEHLLADRGPADVPQTHHADMEPGVGTVRAGRERGGLPGDWAGPGD